MGFGYSFIDAYSHGTTLTDASFFSIVAGALNGGFLPKSSSALYLVILSPDVMISGFCTSWCAWHSYGTIGGSSIIFGVVGDPTRQCPGSCSASAVNVNPNSDMGVGSWNADAMVNLVAHEAVEAATDPRLDVRCVGSPEQRQQHGVTSSRTSPIASGGSKGPHTPLTHTPGVVLCFWC